MGRPNGIDDETYAKLSNAAYSNLVKGAQPADLEGWRVLDDRPDNPISGFDAITFYNPETNQAVIAYRGTEASAGLPNSVPDYITDVGIGINELNRKAAEGIANVTPQWFDDASRKIVEATGLREAVEWGGDVVKDIDSSPWVRGNLNQMYEAEEYARYMSNKYSDLDFSLTGHSLGGGDAQYASVYTGLPAVTFSAPSVIGSLTPAEQRKAMSGEYNDQVVNYAHPGDIVASGTLGGYNRHVGTTYYIDSDYAGANDGRSIQDKIHDSFGGEEYHSLDRYKFENGYISNTLYNADTGELIENSPRLAAYLAQQGMANVGLAVGGLGPIGALLGAQAGAAVGAGGGTIQVTPEELRAVAERWRQNAQLTQGDLEEVRRRLLKYTQSSHSRRLQPIVEQLSMSISELSQWYMQETNDFLFFINYKADLFEQTDQAPLNLG